MKLIDRMNRNRILMTSIALITSTAASGASDGGLDNKGSKAKPAEGTTIEEVVVTARRKEENLQTVPVAVTVVSGAALESKGVANLMDLQRFVPSLRVTTSDVNPKIFFVSIRGFKGSNPRLTEDPPVGTYFAEVPFAHPFAFGDELFDIQSAQVLKGPQGTLFGRNTTGGAVLFEPQKPSTEDGLNGNVKLTLGDYNLRKFDGAVNIPLSESAALRISGQVNQRDGYTTNVLSGDKYDEVDNQALRVQLLLKPTRDITNNLLVSYLDEDGTPANSALYEVYRVPAGASFTALNNLVNIQKGLGARKMYSAVGSNVITGAGIDGFSPLRCATNPSLRCRTDSKPNEKIQSVGIINNTKVDFDGFSVKNILGARRMYHFINSYAIQPTGFVSQGLQAMQQNDYRQVSDELQISGKALDSKLDWIAGAFVFNEHGEDDSPAYQFSSASYTNNKNRDINQTKALFAQGDYKLSDQWKATVGVRKTWDHREADALNYSSTAAGVRSCSTRSPAGVLLTYPNCLMHGERGSDAVTWNMSLQYQASPDTMYYATLSKGYKSGGFSPLINLPSKFAFDPEYVRNLEFGVKSDWSLANMPVRTNAALFHDKYQQQQLQISQIVNNVFANFTDNVGQSTIYGGELEFTLLPTERVEISGFLAYLKAKYDEYQSRANLGGGLTGSVDFSDVPYGGNTPPAHWQGGLSASYKMPLDNAKGTVKFIGDLTWRGRSWTNNDAAIAAHPGGALGTFTPQITEPGRALLNLRVDWNRFLGNPVDVSMYITNVGDKVYIQGGSNVLGATTVHYAEPRMFGIELSYKFGDGFKPQN